jgi:GxxExxY protein
MALIDEEFTYELRGCFFDVQNQVGFGLPEEAYQQGLIRAFARRGIPAKSKDPIWLTYRDQRVVELLPDFVVADRVVLELKALREGFAREHLIQLFSYLKATKLGLGFLVNFGRERIHDWRCIFDEKPFLSEENWDAVKNRIRDPQRSTLAAIRAALSTVGQLYGLGYGEGTYWKLLTTVLRHDGHMLNLTPLAKPHYNEQPLGEFPVDCAVIDECIVCVVTSLKEGLDAFDLARTESYTRNLGLQFGIAAHFGKTKLEMKAVATV